MLGLREFKVYPGIVSAMFPQSDALKFSSGAVCGQAIMAAIDSVASLSVGTTGRITKGTVYQHTHFLRPAVNDDYHVRAEVLRFGRASAFTETRVSFASTGKLVAHASLEFAFWTVASKASSPQPAPRRLFSLALGHPGRGFASF